MKKTKEVNAPLYKSFAHAFDGIISCIGAERNMTIHFVVMVLVITFGIILNISKVEWLFCLIAFALVLSSELINTSLEMTLDICNKNYDPKIKFAKDVAAGAVLINAIIAFCIGVIIFLPYIMEYFI